MAAYSHKPVYPTWQPGHAPAGCKLYAPLAAKAGSAVRNLVGEPGSFVGSPAWSSGFYGPQLSGFTSSNFVTFDWLATRVVSAPFWLAVLASTSASGSTQTLFSLTNSDASHEIEVYLTAAGIFETYQSFGFVVMDSPAALNDGRPHVFMLASYANADHRSYVDGVPVATSTNNSSSPYAFSFLTLGCQRYGASGVTRGAPWGGSIVAAAAGTGAIPGPRALSADWLSGTFAAVRPRREAWPGAEAGPPPAGFAHVGRAFLESSLIR